MTYDPSSGPPQPRPPSKGFGSSWEPSWWGGVLPFCFWLDCWEGEDAWSLSFSLEFLVLSSVEVAVEELVVVFLWDELFLDDWKDDEWCVFVSGFSGSLECFDKIVKKENTVQSLKQKS